MRGRGSGRSGADRFQGRRIALDPPPEANLEIAERGEDAQAARLKAGAPLPEARPLR